MNLKFSGRGLAFLSHYQAKHDIRYYLNGVYVRPLPAEVGGGVLGAATNGHILGMWHDKDGHADRAAILKITPQLVRACAGRAPHGLETALELRDNRLTCTAGAHELYIQPNEYRDRSTKLKAADGEPWEIADKFPDLGRVVPNPAEAINGQEAVVNSEYLGVVAKSLRQTKDWGRGIALRQVDRNGPILVLCPSAPEATIVVMPMHEDRNLAPDWLSRWVRHEKRASAARAAPLPVHEPSDAGPPDGDVMGWRLVEGGA